MSPPEPLWSKGIKADNLSATMGRLFRYIGKYRYLIYAGILISMISSAIILIAPQYLNEVVNKISDHISTGDPMDVDGILQLILILIGLYSAATILRMISGYIIPSASEYNGNVMRKGLGEKITKLPLSIIDRMSVGDVMSRFTNDAENIRWQSAECIAHTISALIMIIGSLIMMFLMEWRLAIISIIPTMLGFILVFVVVRTSQPRFKKQARNLGRTNSLVEETYYGLEVVNSYNGRENVRERFDEINEELFHDSLITRFISSSMPLITGFVSNLSYVIVCIGGAMLVMDNIIGFGTIVAFIIYVKEFSEPLNRLSHTLASIQNVGASAERIFEFFDLPEMEDESGKEKVKEARKGKVVFKDVCFSYIPGKEIIHNLNLTVEPGQKIAIVGPTGSGKTTIANLLMRFYELDSGSITLDGVDLKDMTREDVHRSFCMILQDSWMFNGSIRENITFGRDIPDEKILEACKAVGILDFIKSLPNGLDTVLSEGESVSAGQRQQINMVRAMVRNTPLLILDEATSAIDSSTEKKVQRSMEEIMENRTSFVIAHRLSTIEDADNILVIKNGNIVEQGTHDELMMKGGYYMELYNSQFEDCD